MSYTYKQTEGAPDNPTGLWTVGSHDSGKWEPESDHDSKDEAAARVHYLNGGLPREGIFHIRRPLNSDRQGTYCGAPETERDALSQDERVLLKYDKARQFVRCSECECIRNAGQ